MPSESLIIIRYHPLNIRVKAPLIIEGLLNYAENKFKVEQKQYSCIKTYRAVLKKLLELGYTIQEANQIIFNFRKKNRIDTLIKHSQFLFNCNFLPYSLIEIVTKREGVKNIETLVSYLESSQDKTAKASTEDIIRKINQDQGWKNLKLPNLLNKNEKEKQQECNLSSTKFKDKRSFEETFEVNGVTKKQCLDVNERSNFKVSNQCPHLDFASWKENLAKNLLDELDKGQIPITLPAEILDLIIESPQDKLHPIVPLKNPIFLQSLGEYRNESTLFNSKIECLKTKNGNIYFKKIVEACSVKPRELWTESEKNWYERKSLDATLKEQVIQELLRLFLSAQTKTRRMLLYTEGAINNYLLSKEVKGFNTNLLKNKFVENIKSNIIKQFAKLVVYAVLIAEVDFKIGNVATNQHDKAIKIDGGWAGDPEYQSSSGKSSKITSEVLKKLPAVPTNYFAYNWIGCVWENCNLETFKSLKYFLENDNYFKALTEDFIVFYLLEDYSRAECEEKYNQILTFLKNHGVCGVFSRQSLFQYLNPNVLKTKIEQIENYAMLFEKKTHPALNDERNQALLSVILLPNIIIRTLFKCYALNAEETPIVDKYAEIIIDRKKQIERASFELADFVDYLKTTNVYILKESFIEQILSFPIAKGRTLCEMGLNEKTIRDEIEFKYKAINEKVEHDATHLNNNFVWTASASSSRIETNVNASNIQQFGFFVCSKVNINTNKIQNEPIQNLNFKSL